MAGCFHQLKIDYCVPVDENKREKSLREVKSLEKIKMAIRNIIAVTTNTRPRRFFLSVKPAVSRTPLFPCFSTCSDREGSLIAE